MKKYQVYHREIPHDYVTTLTYSKESVESLSNQGWILKEVTEELSHPLWNDINYLLQLYVDIPEGVDSKVDQLRIMVRNL